MSQPDCQLLPGGVFVVQGEALADLPKKVVRAFAVSPEAGFLALATDGLEESLPAGLGYWRKFARRYLTALRQAPPGDLEESPAPLPDEDSLKRIVNAAPPSPGMEYLSSEILVEVWEGIDAYVAGEAAEHKGGISGWLKERNPLWDLVGRVTFHLAENKRNVDYPFAFLATYTHRLGDSGKLQYVPLGKALAAYAGQKNTRILNALLTPVRAAAEKSSFAKRLVDSKDVFRAQAWGPKEGYEFIRAVPDFEAAGLVVKVPDWWKGKTPGRPTVNVELDAREKTTVGFDSMLNFRASVALDGVPLSEEEWEKLMGATENLVTIRGRWVEVDRDKMKDLLQHWKRVEAATESTGVTFFDGMRWLAGMSGLAASGETDLAVLGTETDAWQQFTAGSQLKDMLAGMRDPDAIGQSVKLGRSLKADLRPYQQTGANWLWMFYRLGMGACLADDMGLGKTLQVIALLLQIKKVDQGKPPSLLVVPASLVGNWKAEAEKFAPSLRFFCAHRSQVSAAELDNLEEHAANCDAVVTTYSMLRRLDGIAERQWNVVVLDEAQAIKNPGSGVTKAVKALDARVRLALTGTPVENSAGDLWSLFDFINPGLLGSSAKFSQATKKLAKEGGTGYAPLRKLVSPYILRRLKTDKSIIDDLPDKTEVRTRTGLTKGQAALYRKGVQQLAKDLADPTIEGIERNGLIFSYLMQFKQICDHPSLWTGSGNFLEKDSGKFARLRALAEEIGARGEKMLVFTQFREMTGPIATFLETIFGRPGLVLHGGTAVSRRQKLVKQFQEPGGPPFFVISLKAGGTGLTLTAASHVIHFDRWWNPAVEDQATDRAYRIGQKRNVLVHKFVCPGTVEERIDQLIEDKRELATDLLGKGDGAEKLLTAMDDDELLKFVRLDIDSAVL